MSKKSQKHDFPPDLQQMISGDLYLINQMCDISAKLPHDAGVTLKNQITEIFTSLVDGVHKLRMGVKAEENK